MNINLSNSLAGLTLLGGRNGSTDVGATKIESRAVRLAKAQFNLPRVTPPWQGKRSSEPQSAAVSTVRRMTRIVDKAQAGATVPADVQTAFTAYKALDRLRTLAGWSARATTSSAERASLQSSFIRGLTDLQAYLAGTSGDALTLSFAAPGRRAESVALEAAPSLEVQGTAVSSDRFAPLAGLTGNERFELRLSRTGASDTVTIDLAALHQPPTLDGIANAINARIAAIPMTGAGGTPVLDGSGQPVPRWGTSFSVVKSADGWGLQLNTAGIEQASLSQQGAGDTLIVATGQVTASAAPATVLTRFDLAGGELQRSALGTLTALDRQATAEARLLPAAVDSGAAVPSPPPTVAAAVETSAAVTGADGFTYLVGSTSGDLGADLGDGSNDLMLTKLDAAGGIVWQRTLGISGSATGSALSIAANGDIIVAGTADGNVDGAGSDGDMLVARYSPAGDERFLTLVRSAGVDAASAITVAADGSIVIGGHVADGGGGALLARLDGSGRLLERRMLGGGSAASVRALQAEADGSVVALSMEGGSAILRRVAAESLGVDRNRLDLGQVGAHALALAPDGRIAVGGNQNGDGFVTVIDAAMAAAVQTAIASAGDDRVDSLAWAGNELYAGGRTSGVLGVDLTGMLDSFVARIDPAAVSVAKLQQWGRPGARMEPVQLALGRGLDTAVPALGFQPGVLNPPDSTKLVAQTSIRAGDRFSLRLDDGTVREFAVAADDTLATLAQRISTTLGRNVSATAAKVEGGVALRLEAKPGHSLQLIAGPQGRDALAKLGLSASRLVAAAPVDPKAPRVAPGGNYGLELSAALNIRDAQSATAALGKLTAAIGTAQSAYRSLYWDENKEAIVNGGASGKASPYLSPQLARYQDSLSRLGGNSLAAGF